MKGARRPSPPPPPLRWLHGTKESNKSKKRQRHPPAASALLHNPTSSAPQLPQQQQREAVIIHLDEPPVYQAANPQEFKELVQRLTGMSPGPARAKEVPTAASTAPKAVQSSASDSSDAAAREEMIRWMIKKDDPKFKIGQSSSRILSPTPLSPAQKAVQSSASDSGHAAWEEKIRWMMKKDDPKFKIGQSSSRILSPTPLSPAQKVVQSSASDSGHAAWEEKIRWMMKKDDPKFKIGQSSSRILSPMPLSPAQKAFQSSASDSSHAALEKIKWIMEEEGPEFEIGLSPTPTTLRQISPQDCFFPGSDKKAVLQGISGQFPPPSPWQIAPQDSFFSGSDTNAVLKGNSGQLPRPLQPQEPPPMPQIAPVTPPPIRAYHSSTANNSLPSIVPSISSLLPITAQYKLPQQIQGPQSVPWNRSSQQTSVPKNLEGPMWPVTEDEVDRILARFEQIQLPPSVPSNCSLSPINEHSNLPQGLRVPYRSSWMSTTTSPEIQQTSVPDNLALTEDEVERLLASLEPTKGPPSVLPNSSLSPINEHHDSPQGLRVPHRSLSTSTTAQTYNSSPEIQQTSAMWPVTEDEVDRMLAGFDFEHQEPFPRLPTP